LPRRFTSLSFCKKKLRLGAFTEFFFVDLFAMFLLGTLIALTTAQNSARCARAGSVYVFQHLVTIQIQSAAANL
jgi:hypothetical protein